jgi:hypothetical protein
VVKNNQGTFVIGAPTRVGMTVAVGADVTGAIDGSKWCGGLAMSPDAPSAPQPHYAGVGYVAQWEANGKLLTNDLYAGGCMSARG